jgi:hypothetical protein
MPVRSSSYQEQEGQYQAYRTALLGGLCAKRSLTEAYGTRLGSYDQHEYQAYYHGRDPNGSPFLAPGCISLTSVPCPRNGWLKTPLCNPNP